MTTLTNSFEGGTSGTTITTGNSGGVSGNAFDVVTIGASAALTFSSAEAAHGSLCGQFITPGTDTNCFVGWSASLTGSSLPQAWARAYVYLPSIPSAGVLRVIRWLNGTTLLGAIGITSASKVVTLNSAGATQTTSTASVPPGAWFRLEAYLIGSPAAGQIQVEIYNTPDATVPAETDTTGSAVNTANTVTGIAFGNPTSEASFTLYLDDLGASGTGYIGPAVTAAGGGGSIVAALIASGTI